MRKKFSFALTIALGISCIIPVFAEAQSTKIQSLIDMKYVEGYEDGSLKLDSPITRAEFTKLVIVAIGEENEALRFKSEKSKFSDVDLNHWANGFVNLAVEKGYVKGHGDGTFKPQDNLTMEEAIAIVARLYPNFREKKSEDHWSKQYIDFARENGILDDINVSDFSKTIDRKSAFEIIYNYDKGVKSRDKIEANEVKVEEKTKSHKYYDSYFPDLSHNKKINYIRIRFYVDGDRVSTKYFEDGDYLKLPKAPVKDGYEFLGWYSGDTLYNEYDRAYNNLDLTAKFKKLDDEKKQDITVDPEKPIEKENQNDPDDSEDIKKPDESENQDNDIDQENPNEPADEEDSGETENPDEIKSSDASLKEIIVYDNVIKGFNPETLNYTFELPLRTTIIPKIKYTKSNESEEVEVTHATNYKDDNTTKIKVKAKDGTERIYSVTFVKKDGAMSSDASLEYIRIHGLYWKDFDSEKTSYVYELDRKEKNVPEIRIKTRDEKAKYEYRRATNFTDDNISYITVTAEDGTVRVYTIKYVLRGPYSKNVNLKEVKVDGEAIDLNSMVGFTFTIELEKGTTRVPIVEATAEDPKSVVTIIQAKDLVREYNAQIEVKAESKNMRAYIVKFIVKQE